MSRRAIINIPAVTGDLVITAKTYNATLTGEKYVFSNTQTKSLVGSYTNNITFEGDEWDSKPVCYMGEDRQTLSFTNNTYVVTIPELTGDISIYPTALSDSASTYFGQDDIGNLYFGTFQVKRMYFGDTMIYNKVILPRLSPPTISLDTTSWIISWSAVAGADKYILVNAETGAVIDNNITETQVYVPNEGLSDGFYNLAVRSSGEGYQDSEISNVVDYTSGTILTRPNNLVVSQTDGINLEFDVYEDQADEFEVYVDGVLLHRYPYSGQ